ncbi:MAG: peptidylprolyl isomerase SurA [Gammaproteobacteria bacterium]|nr:peptidylprolyl isomerase SurA [Gammaproteobacteria bacterium]
MKPLYYLILGLVVASLTPLPGHAATRPQDMDLDRVVAIVNNDVITSSELSDRVTQIKHQLEQKHTQLPPDDILRKQILDRMILDEIQLQLAKTAGIRVDDEQLNQVVTNIAKQNSMSLDQFRKFLENEGYPFAKFREEIRKEVIIGQLRKNKVDNQVYVSEQEVDNQLSKLGDHQELDTEYHLAHILIPIPEEASPEQIDAAKQKAEEVYTQLNLGADFAKTAVSVSADQRALQGGDLGWIKQGQLPTVFADMVPKMKPGDITKPVRSASGFHIIKLLDTRREDQKHIVEQTLARHILIKTSEIVSSDEARQKLERIRSEIVGGRDFGAVARASSDDTGSAADGGNLGWVSPGTMVPEFEEEMNKLKPGEISQPFQTRFGWHIVQVMSRRKFDDTKAYLRLQARNQIQQRKIAEETENWLRRIRDEAYVHIVKQ